VAIFIMIHKNNNYNNNNNKKWLPTATLARIQWQLILHPYIPTTLRL
jgi:hypothetical protein